MLKTLFVKAVLFVEMLVSLNTNQEATTLTVAQKIYEQSVIEELAEEKEDLKDFDFDDCNFEKADLDIRLTWLDSNTCIKEIIIIIDDVDMIGMDSIVDIDEYGDVDEETVFRYFIGDESYADAYIWSENCEMIYDGLITTK